LDLGPDPVSGRRRQQTGSGFATERAAKAALAEFRGRVAVTGGRSEELTVADWLERWLDAKRVGRKPSTVAGYQQLVTSHIRPGLGSLRLVELSADDIQRWVARLTATSAYTVGQAPNVRSRADRHHTTLASGTVRNAFAVLRAALNLAVRRRMLVANPCWGVELPELRRTTGTAWNPAQAGRFLDAVATDRLYPAWHLLLHAGPRRSQLAGLLWDDVDLDEALMTLRHADTQTGGTVHRGGTNKNHHDTPVGLDRGTVAVLRAWKARQNTERLAWGAAYQASGHVFTHQDGTALMPAYLSRRWTELVTQADVPPIRLHDGRHTHATVGLINAGVPLVTMSRRLGHSGVEITADIYTHVDLSAQHAAADSIAAIIAHHRTG